MKRLKRPVLWAIGLVFLVLLGFAIYAYFIGTRTFLEYAEAFSFRRMTVARLAEQGGFRFFYVTNRRPGVVDASIEERFLPEREATLKLGHFDTTIEPTLGLGMLINASHWFLNEDIRLEKVQALEREKFVALLKAQVQTSPRESLLVVVHGF